MALPATVSHIGSLSGSPSSGAVGVPSLIEIINTSFGATYQSSKSGRPSVVGATIGSPFVLALETITKVRVFAMQVRSGNLTVLVTSSAGVDQAYNCGGMTLLHLPFAGNELTAIKLVGTGDIEYFVAGDVS